MNELQIFNFQNKGTVRTVIRVGEPWFVAKDVCELLDIKNATDVIKRLDLDEVTRFNLGGLSGETNIVNESGLYSLVIGSRKQEAREFKRWITHEVIPSIRKHGAYMTAETLQQALLNPDTIIRLATQLKDEQERSKHLTAKVEADKPKVLFADSVAASHTSILIGEFAKILRQNGVEIGQNRLFEWLRNHGYLISRAGTDYNMPTQYSMERKLMTIKETTINKPDGSVMISKTVKLTGRAQVYFIEKFLGYKELSVKNA